MNRRRQTCVCLAVTAMSAFFTGFVSAQSSGMLLGIRATEPQGPGLYVQSTIPGYSADGVLRRGDLVLRVTDGVRIFRTDTLRQIETAKTRIGAGTTAEVEVSRRNPNGRRTLKYFTVIFQPVGGVARSVGASGEVRTRSIGTPPGAKKGDYTAEFEKSEGTLFEKAKGKAEDKTSSSKSSGASDSPKGNLFRKAEEN